MTTIFITGVSSGIGRALAVHCLACGYDVWGSARHQSHFGDLAQHPLFHALVLDVTDAIGRHAAIELLGKQLGERRLDLLINNAGIALSGPIKELTQRHWQQQFEVNLFAVIEITNLCLPLLERDGDGKAKVINLSSVSGKIAYPFLAPYAASKFALEAYTDAMRRELFDNNVAFTLIEPASVASEIWQKAELALSDFDPQGRYVQVMRKQMQQPKQTILMAKVLLVFDKIIASRQPKARYALPRRWLTGWWLPRLLPTAVFDAISKRVIQTLLRT